MLQAFILLLAYRVKYRNAIPRRRVFFSMDVVSRCSTLECFDGSVDIISPDRLKRRSSMPLLYLALFIIEYTDMAFLPRVDLTSDRFGAERGY